MFGLVFKKQNTFFKNCCARLNFDLFLTPMTTRKTAILQNFVEAVLNLFMKLPTSTGTKLVYLGIELEAI